MAEYIDKNTAITAVGESIADGASWFDALERIPPADVRPVVRGQWVRHYCDDDGVPDGWSCDRCKEWYVFGPSKPNFCPNCGADMREGGNGDEESGG